MRKILLTSIVALCLTTSAFAQTNSYASPFGGTYLGDFKKYSPENTLDEKNQSNKVELSRIVLLNDDKTLRSNVDVDSMANYVKALEKNTINILNSLTQSNEVVLEASVSRNEHKVRIALKNQLNQKDMLVIGNLEKRLNKLPPFATRENIKLHIYFIVDNSLPIATKNIIKTE